MQRDPYKYINIIPHKSILSKITNTGYTVQEALSELIDNSVDAREDGRLCSIQVTLSTDTITISDNASGMDEEGITNAMRLGYSTKTGMLGEFGLGMKTACSFFGKSFTIHTKVAGSESTYILEYDEDEWMKSGEWDKFPLYCESGSNRETSGTTIKISRVRFELTNGMLEKIKDEMAKRFGPFIESKAIQIELNGSVISPKETSVLEDTRQEFFIDTEFGKVHGWWGCKLEGLNNNYYGFNVFRRGRLITVFDKIGFNTEHQVKQIIGEINADFLPVTHNKKGFIKTSKEYDVTRNALMDYFKIHEKKPRRLLAGYSASTGIVAGTVKIIQVKQNQDIDRQLLIEKIRPGDILVTEMTRPNYLLAVRRAGGIITNLGGNLSHAAIVAREFNIPCVTGTQNATTVLSDGQKVILDAYSGSVYEY